MSEASRQDDEIKRLRERIHDIADDVQAISLQHAETRAAISSLRESIEGLKQAVDERWKDRRMEVDRRLAEIDARITSYVTHDQFWPVKTLVYGITATILVGVLAWAGSILLAAHAAAE